MVQGPAGEEDEGEEAIKVKEEGADKDDDDADDLYGDANTGDASPKLSLGGMASPFASTKPKRYNLKVRPHAPPPPALSAFCASLVWTVERRSVCHMRQMP